MATVHTLGERIRPFLVRSPALLPLRKARLEWKARHGGYPDWSAVIDDPAWARARKDAEGGPRVLIATNVGLHFAANTVESLLAVALTLRGAEVEILLCDGALPACMACQSDWFPREKRFVDHGPARDLCGMCHRHGSRLYETLGLAVHRFSDNLELGERERVVEEIAALDQSAISELEDVGVALGEHAVAGALRYYAKGSLDEEPNGSDVLRRYAAAAVLTAKQFDRLLAKRSYDVVVLHHGIYVPQGPIVEVARAGDVRVVTWNPSYREGTCIFSEGGSYHHTLMDEPIDVWEGLELDGRQERRLMSYLESRRTGGGDGISFSPADSLDDTRSIRESLGLDDRPVIGLLTNVVWDAQLHYPRNVFPDMLTWLRETVTWFAGRRELQLLIRVHPAEVRGFLRSQQPVSEEIRRWFPQMPENVRVIGPESRISTYSAMELCDSVLIYGTKTGVELTAVGIPVIVAGEAWIRNKGLTIDPCDRHDYFRILGQLPFGKRLTQDVVDRARRYAFHFFFRRMIPIDALTPKDGYPPFAVDVREVAQFMPGVDEGLDVVCRGILHNTPYMFPVG